MKERRKNYLEIDTIIDRAIQKSVPVAVKEALTNIGFDMSEPTEIQADVQHLKRSRKICEIIQDKAVTVGIGLLVTGGFGALWIGIKAML